ncbi:MAG TPA: hypothetical protein VIV84_03440 [Burkholderiaceae bacterium]
MIRQPPTRIEPSKHSTDEVDEFLEMVEDNVDRIPDAETPAIKPNKELGEDGKPITETQDNAST